MTKKESIPKKKPYPKTIYEVSWGGLSTEGSIAGRRYFDVWQNSDALVLFSKTIIELDSAVSVSGAWVRLSRLADSIYFDGMLISAWTKTSNERPTEPGVLSPEDLISNTTAEN